MNLSVCLSISLSVNLFICLSMYLSIWVHLYIRTSSMIEFPAILKLATGVHLRRLHIFRLSLQFLDVHLNTNVWDHVWLRSRQTSWNMFSIQTSGKNPTWFMVNVWYSVANLAFIPTKKCPKIHLYRMSNHLSQKSKTSGFPKHPFQKIHTFPNIFSNIFDLSKESQHFFVPIWLEGSWRCSSLPCASPRWSPAPRPRTASPRAFGTRRPSKNNGAVAIDGFFGCGSIWLLVPQVGRYEKNMMFDFWLHCLSRLVFFWVICCCFFKDLMRFVCFFCFVFSFPFEDVEFQRVLSGALWVKTSHLGQWSRELWWF